MLTTYSIKPIPDITHDEEENTGRKRPLLALSNQIDWFEKMS
jgi:hypothetical protein